MKDSKIYEHKCLRCGHRWASRRAKPVRCANCKSPYWHIPKGQVEEHACHFCGSTDILVPLVGIAWGMAGNDYSFCRKCLHDITAEKFWERMFKEEGYTWPPTLKD
jgi:hypothetical protein